ncbi:MAG: hypothetical protein A3K19_16920 [Lentisphaerae bacterium RIFOXYB12_FULL_65_16]|nr:MAG: hypothetical protein A3K18_17880 [Lentisphaerae bacterium RIFOXYA12_64_32]OGV88930.1 MAG: hypothetical protein A3K19_16920 [Lentisphaerae bacterium RIFOXYB12_FULL_65_16]
MTILMLALLLLLLSGVAAFLLRSRPTAASVAGAAGPVAAAMLALVPALTVLRGGEVLSTELPWAMPFGRFCVQLDALSALFILPILGLSALGAVYGIEYLRPYIGKYSIGSSWLCYNLLVASMVLVCLARNALLFLLAWELMAFSSFFLVAFENRRKEVRNAAWTYLVATHIGTAFLLPMFLSFGQAAGSLDFAQFAGCLGPAQAGVCFVLAVIGFGTKAGIMPLHVWLPEAHPAAPSHVSAVMSGVMLKTGIYGLVRVLSFLVATPGAPPAWWGWLLLIVGAVSGILGVLFALAQHDLKRLLAYHSVENIGIIILGLGVGLIGLSAGAPVVAALGFAGGLLHVVNHAVFKGLLFLGAGSVLHAVHTREIDHLGGLLRRMPLTGLTFLTGAVAISGLPPLNGFISEFLIYAGAFQGTVNGAAPVAAPLVLVILALALIGGLAVACFTKAFGIVFLGEPRGAAAAAAHESGRLMTVPMLLLAGACLAGGLLAPFLLPALATAVAPLAGAAAIAPLQTAGPLLVWVSGISAGVLLAALLFAAWKRWLLTGRDVRRAVTWDCGYAAPSPRMQYTASSFAQPLTDFFEVLLRTRKHMRLPDVHFPTAANIETETPDVSRESLYAPLFNATGRVLSRVRVMQSGCIQVYVLYLVLTLLVLLIWKL